MLNKYTFGTLNSVELSENVRLAGDTGFRFILEYRGFNFPILIKVSKNNSDTLLITYNGAIDRSKAPNGMVFQRSSWLDRLEATVISLADPTLLKHPITLGWGQLDGTAFAPELFAEIIEKLRGLAELPKPSRTLHFGSSAGGFQAFATACFDQGSKVLVNNPQFDWLKYDLKGPVNAVLEQVYQGKTSQHLLDEAPWRVRIWDLFQKVSFIPDSTIEINIASHNDFIVQFEGFKNALNAMNFLPTSTRINFTFYRDPIAGHSPLAEIPAITSINRHLGLLE